VFVDAARLGRGLFVIHLDLVLFLGSGTPALLCGRGSSLPLHS
jgi:hypothetical protein